MNNLRNIFKSKDFIVNSNMIKCISKLDITLEEFLLVLYFINISDNLDSDDIKDKLGYDDDKTFNTFNSLINKKYIEMEVESKDGKVLEKIKLDCFYDRLALNQNNDKDTKDIYSLFERELGRTLSTFEAEMINKWLENGNDEKTIKEALKEAILNGVSSFKYIDKIIYDWSKNGVKKRIKEENIKNNHEELFDYDWLDENE